MSQATAIAAPAVYGKEAVCLHCGQSIPRASASEYCCNGCRAVHATINSLGLSRFYELRRGAGVSASNLAGDHKWLDRWEAEHKDELRDRHLQLDIQGIHCAACVWLLQQVFEKHGVASNGRILINPALGRADVWVSADYPLRDWVRSVESLGYSVGTSSEKKRSRSDELLLRLVICAVLAGNTMLFAIAMYLGLNEGRLFEMVSTLNFASGVVSVLVGGSVFFRSALEGLRSKTLHLDLPISIGIALACAGSSWAYLVGREEATYFDSLTVFIALMLLGRWLQQRTIEKAQARLLQDQGIEGLLTRRMNAGALEIVPCEDIRNGDELLVAPGDLLPVEARLVDDTTACSLDWINGEVEARTFRQGDTLPAGAVNASDRAFSAVAETSFSISMVRHLLTSRPNAGADSADKDAHSWWSRVSFFYVVGVLGVAGGSMIAWAFVSADAAKSIEVATAILVVTCPCAFGLAVPLASEVVLARLRMMGLFVRRSGLLDRAARVKRVVFDKTGTLTTGAAFADVEESLSKLSAAETSVLYAMVATSVHPKSVALRKALESAGVGQWCALEVREHAGLGLSVRHGGRDYRLGKPTWVEPGVNASDEDLAFSVDGSILFKASTTEELRAGAYEQVQKIRRSGYDVSILSGDSQTRVDAVGDVLGLDRSAGVGNQTPDDKATVIKAGDAEQTLLVGDGLNDSLAAGVAGCSGAVAIERPMMASRCDFYVGRATAAPIHALLVGARAFRRVVRIDLLFAVAYNTIAVAFAAAGMMKPWLAAVLMPISSLVTIGFTVTALSQRSPLWRS